MMVVTWVKRPGKCWGGRSAEAMPRIRSPRPSLRLRHLSHSHIARRHRRTQQNTHRWRADGRRVGTSSLLSRERGASVAARAGAIDDGAAQCLRPESCSTGKDFLGSPSRSCEEAFRGSLCQRGPVNTPRPHRRAIPPSLALDSSRARETQPPRPHSIRRAPLPAGPPMRQQTRGRTLGEGFWKLDSPPDGCHVATPAASEPNSKALSHSQRPASSHGACTSSLRLRAPDQAAAGPTCMAYAWSTVSALLSAAARPRAAPAPHGRSRNACFATVPTAPPARAPPLHILISACRSRVG
ncbi:hypothetical protein BDV95DRAFT_654344 [Massariosphaeria phaeospora]|uniref:Uncharacterized protein n=1 Tax=Massariosphaeria phaeospora TaxID=100035 RepID=A0A7C8IJ31_9PLEO|nr:hypothetical protein BDV95DRAFT_654344 [Massariosphaeria phaeospora]